MKLKTNFLVGAIAFVASIAFFGLSAYSISDSSYVQQHGLKRTDLQRHDLSIPGREVMQARINLYPGVLSPKHSHPGEEIIYVLEGLLEYQVEGKTAVTLKAGDVFFIPAGTAHTAKNVGSGKGSELATYVVQKR
jgi:quercetin dioxygenase-like cupin family protein